MKGEMKNNKESNEEEVEINRRMAENMISMYDVMAKKNQRIRIAFYRAQQNYVSYQ